MEPTWINVILAIVSVIALILSARATNSKVKVKAEADTMVAKAQGELRRAEADIQEKAGLLNMIKELTQYNREQSRQNRDFLIGMKRLKAAREQDYKTLKAVYDDNAQLILTEVQLVKSAVNTSKSEIMTRVDTLDTSLQSWQKNSIQEVASEFAAVLAAKFQEKVFLQEQYPFPALDDPEWIEDFIKPLVSHVHVYRRPFANDTTRMTFELLAEGENISLYRGWRKDWLAVSFTRGRKGVFGWVQEHEVLVGLPAAKLATSETAIPSSVTPSSNGE